MLYQPHDDVGRGRTSTPLAILRLPPNPWDGCGEPQVRRLSARSSKAGSGRLALVPARIAHPGCERVQHLAQCLRIGAPGRDGHMKGVVGALDDLQCRQRVELVNGGPAEIDRLMHDVLPGGTASTKRGRLDALLRLLDAI